MIEQTRFPSTVFLRSEFKLGNIYSGVNFPGKMFAVIFICGNLFLRIAGKTAKIGTRKKFVPHGKGTRFIRRLQKSREVSVNSVEWGPDACVWWCGWQMWKSGWKKNMVKWSNYYQNNSNNNNNLILIIIIIIIIIIITITRKYEIYLKF